MFTASGITVGIYDSAGVLQCLNQPQPLSSVGQYTFDGQGSFTRVDFNVGASLSTTPPRRSMGQAFAPAGPVRIPSARTAQAKLP
jgi:hypothetical protein